jgi:thiamine biosynthesis lipoprotein
MSVKRGATGCGRAATRPALIGALLAALIGALLAGPAAAAKKPHPGEHDVRATVQQMRVVMGTPCTMIAEGADSLWAKASLDSAFDILSELDDLLTLWRDGSELSALDSARAELRTSVSPRLYAVIDSALAIAADTDGAFDPTIEPLTRAWDLRGEGRVPTPEELSDARYRTGWQMVQIEPTLQTVRFRRDRMGFDLDGIAKGFALDQAISFLRSRRLARVLIDFGSDLAGFTDGEAWTVDIGDPDDRNQPAVRLVMRQGGISSSGQSARFFTKSGGHEDRVLDPASGHPVERLATVTVVAPSATRSDAFATALLVMGRERVPEFLASHRDLGVLWLEHQGHALRAWRWNLPTVSAAPNVRIDWVQ